MAKKQVTTSKVAVIGTGFGGIGLGYYLKQAGIDSFVMFEKSDTLGGTWRDNTYPGAGCDVPSHLYSYSFESHYPWRFRYGKQKEIFDYMQHCAKKYDLLRHMQFKCEVKGAKFDEKRNVWAIELADGRVHEAQFLISSVGQLNRPGYANVPGIHDFTGKAFHSAEWDHEYDLSGKTVAVIGTGASAVQFVPQIAKQVKKLYVYQRTPGWTIPKVEKEFSPLERKVLDTIKVLHDIDRARIFTLTELVGYAYQGHKWAERVVQALAQLHLRRQVKDKALRKKLTPDYPVGCKRILLSNEWLSTLDSPNVEVVTEGLEKIEDQQLYSPDGKVRTVDTIIHGTGFKATEFLAPMDFKGLGGESLREKWANGASAYFGMSVHGFPNFFMTYGPNTNLGSGSIIYMLECQQRYITQIIQDQVTAGWSRLSVRPEAEAEFVNEMRSRSEASVYAGDCQSWYKTADGTNTNTWIGLQREYGERTRAPEFRDYEIA